MEREKTGVRKRSAKAAQRGAPVAKPSAAKPSIVKLSVAKPPFTKPPFTKPPFTKPPFTKPSRSAPRAAPVAKPARPRLLASADLSSSLGYRIRRAQLWVFKDVSRRLAAFDISPAQFSVLSVIGANPGVNQLAIAQSLSIERAGLGRLVDHLERRGLVQRSASAINRRYYVLYLTQTGAALLGRLRPAIAESEKALAAKLGSGAFKQLQRALSIFLGDD